MAEKHVNIAALAHGYSIPTPHASCVATLRTRGSKKRAADDEESNTKLPKYLICDDNDINCQVGSG